MADQYVQVAPNSTGAKVDVSELTVGANTVERQRMVLADPTAAASLAGVSAAGELQVVGTQVNNPTETTPFLNVMQAPQKTWRCGYDATVGAGPDTVFMTAVANGSGIAVSQSSGSLVITTGTTAYSETILRSVPSWNGSFKARYSLTLSQRIINCEVYLELVDVIGDALTIVHNSTSSVTVTIPSNPFTAKNVGQGIYIGAISTASSLNQRATIASISGNDVTFTGAGFAASGTGTCSLFGWNFHHVLYDGTTATTTKYGTGRNGWTAADAVPTINTTVSGHVGVMSADGAKGAYYDQLSGTSTTVELLQRAASVRNVPEDQTTLRYQVRIRNLAVAPLSTTTVTVGFFEMDQFIPQQVSLVSVEPQSVNYALGVQVVNTPSVKVTDGTNFLPTGDALARPLFVKPTDGVNVPAVKGASTAAVAADASMVVNISPNSPSHPIAGAVTDRQAPGTSNFVPIAGWDNNVVRRILTDLAGAQAVAGMQTAAVSSEALVDLATKILIELKQVNYLLHELPAILSQSFLPQVGGVVVPLDEDKIFREDPTLLVN